jgi:hypothetical protein
VLHYPFADKLHPQAEDLKHYARNWVQRMGLVHTDAELERFEAAQYWRLVAGAYPMLPWDILTIAHDWSCWGFLLDDIDDSSQASSEPATLRRLFAQVQAILNNVPPDGAQTPFLEALRDVWQRMRAFSSSQWQHRFRQTLAQCLTAYHWEALNRVNRKIPTLPEYLAHRRQTSGWMTELLLIDLAQGQALPPHIYNDPALQRLLDTANTVICWANDLHSYSKEQTLGEVYNLVVVVQAAYRCDLEAARNLVAAWHNMEIERWRSQVNQLPRWRWRDAQHVQAYVTFSERFMRSNYEWSQVTGRYAIPSSS